jgi:hypothetical protein
LHHKRVSSSMSPAENTHIVAINETGHRIGSSHHNSTISDEIVDKVRDMHEDDGVSYGKIAKLIGLTKSFVAKICRYERRAQTPDKWKRVKKHGKDHQTIS